LIGVLISVWFFVGFKMNGPDFETILNELVEEDFTGRTLDNVKAMYLLVSIRQTMKALC